MIKDVVKMLRENPLKWTFLGIIMCLICWVFYQDQKDILPWYGIVISCVLGGLLGLVLVAKTVEPLNKYLDSKTRSWFKIKK
jgi:RsiW-degrading membrane proteinase PrsW (M82 family)